MASYTITGLVSNSKYGASVTWTETTAIPGTGTQADPWGGTTGLATNDTVTIANNSSSGSKITIEGVDTTTWTESSTGPFDIAAGSSKTFTIASQGNSDDTWTIKSYSTQNTAYSSFIYFSNKAAAATPTYSINAPASINEGSAGTVNVTTTNVSNGTTLYWDLDLTDDYSTTQGTVTINSNAGSFTITPTADSSTEGAETDTIRLYSDSGRTTQVATDSFTINDTSTGSGGSDGGSDGSSTYGLEVTGPDGSTTVFSSGLRQMNAVQLATATLGSQGSVSYTGIAEATDSAKIAVVVAKNNPSYFSTQGVTVTRSSASGGTITLTNVSTSSVTIKVSIYRIS